MKNIISWSGGKDSTATVILAHQMGLPVDEVIYCEVMYDKIRGISGELPEHAEFIKKVAMPRFEQWGYKVTTVRADKDFLDIFFARKKKGSHPGSMYGYLISGRCMGVNSLKRRPMDAYKKTLGEYVEYVGIAVDEQVRLRRLKSHQRSLLAECGLTEKDAYRLCAQEGLLSPIYNFDPRGGCWFCPNSDYQLFDYPDGCVVVDNPPFSILSKIVRFYLARHIHFFLFAPGLSSIVAAGAANTVCIGGEVEYANGAKVNTGFVTDLGENAIETAPDLSREIRRINDENRKEKAKQVRRFSFPDEVMTAAKGKYLAVHGVRFAVKREDAVYSSDACGEKIFGGCFLLSPRAAAERAAAERKQLTHADRMLLRMAFGDKED